MNGSEDLALCDFFAAADDSAVCRICGDHTVLFAERQIAEADAFRTLRLPSGSAFPAERSVRKDRYTDPGFFRQFTSLRTSISQQHGFREQPDGRCGREARRLDPRKVQKVFSRTVKDKISPVSVRAQTGKLRNGLLHRNFRKKFLFLARDCRQSFCRDAPILFIVLIF